VSDIYERLEDGNLAAWRNDCSLGYCDQVQQIVEKVPSLKRISFVAHSLGGLFARYAVAMMYTPKDEDMCILKDLESRGDEHPVFRLRREPKIAGLEAVNFITLASPHLGVRGKQQVSYLRGLWH
jgi:hypothetical protein